MTGERTERLRIGLVIESELQPWNLFDLVEWAGSRDDLAITHLLLRRGHGHIGSGSVGTSRSHGFPNRLSEWLFSLLTRLESPMVRHRIPAFRSAARRNVAELGATVVELTTKDRSRGGSAGSDEPWSEESLEVIRKLDLDLILALGPGLTDSVVAATARLGAVSVEHGSEAAVVADAVGFWEVFLQRDTTNFRILQHGSNGSKVLLTGGVRNRPSFLLNQVALMRMSLHHLKGLLANVSASGKLSEGSGTRPPHCDPRRAPGCGEQIAYAARSFALLARKRLATRILRGGPRWTVFFSPVAWAELDASRAIPIENPRNGFLADPFVIEAAGRTYCFVEELEFDDGRGWISAYELTESRAIRIGKVIAEPFHMSFPYLFRHGTGIYMVPETASNGDIRIYECVRMPDGWTLKKSLSIGTPTADTMLFEHAGRWWMFTNPDPGGIGDHCSELHIFHSDDPFSDRWTPHPKNPITLDPLVARNGGILSDGKSLYRIAQRQGFDRYGIDFSLYRIEVLTPEDYVEIERNEERPHSFERPSGVHHMHSNGMFSVFDHDRVGGRAARWESKAVRPGAQTTRGATTTAPS